MSLAHEKKAGLILNRRRLHHEKNIHPSQLKNHIKKENEFLFGKNNVTEDPSCTSKHLHHTTFHPYNIHILFLHASWTQLTATMLTPFYHSFFFLLQHITLHKLHILLLSTFSYSLHGTIYNHTIYPLSYYNKDKLYSSPTIHLHHPTTKLHNLPTTTWYHT